jgi:hypothetical protein
MLVLIPFVALLGVQLPSCKGFATLLSANPEHWMLMA